MGMRRQVNLVIGQKINKLTLVADGGRHPSNGRKLWICACDCGITKPIYQLSLIKNQKSCGCLLKDYTRINNLSKSQRLNIPIGYKHYKLTILNNEVMHNNRVHYLCICECGVKKLISPKTFKEVKSCGCLLRSKSAARMRILSYKHGEALKTPEYTAWASMLDRCRNSKHKFYARYGGRGIKVCERWSNSYSNFLSDVGRRPSKKYSLDRIDNDGDYKPDNVRWATHKVQGENRHNTHWIEFNNEKLSLSDWERKTGLHRSTIRKRLEMGWTAERALNTPAMTGKERQKLAMMSRKMSKGY